MGTPSDGASEAAQQSRTHSDRIIQTAGEQAVPFTADALFWRGGVPSRCPLPNLGGSYISQETCVARRRPLYVALEGASGAPALPWTAP